MRVGGVGANYLTDADAVAAVAVVVIVIAAAVIVEVFSPSL